MGVKKVCLQTSLDAKICFHENQIKLHQSNFFYSSEDRRGKIFLVEKLLQQKKSLFSDVAEKSLPSRNIDQKIATHEKKSKIFDW